MITPQIVAQVQLEHAERKMRRLAQPGRPGAAPGLVVIGCLGAAAALFLGFALAGAL
jgi:hypothetical protein